MTARLAALAALAAALAAPSAATGQQSRLERGRDLYVAGCISCHGSQLQGVDPVGPRRGAGGETVGGPPLRGVGARAADFYLRLGYMPLRSAFEMPRRGEPAYPDADIRALVAYIASFGGPQVPRPRPERGRLDEGLQLFTEHCAGCHQVAGRGGVVTNAVAPPLSNLTPTQIAEAVRTGPYLMPAFPPSQISDRGLDSIVRYVRYIQSPDDRGGWPIGHLGPVTEGLVAWLLAGTALVLLAAAIGSRAR